MITLSFFEKKNYWIKELGEINKNFPKKRIKLTKLLETEDKSFETAEGKVSFPIEEFKSFCGLFNTQIYQNISLPIVILRKKDFFVTSGNKYDTWIVERLMGHEDSNIIISIQNYIPKHTHYFTYQVNRIRKMFPTIIQVVYSM